jgi:EpsI family protein
MLEDHLWQGWVIFTLLMVPTYFAVRRIEKRDSGRPRTPGLVPAAHDPARVPRAMGAGAMALLGPILLVGVGLMPSAGELDRDPEVFDVNDAWATTPSAESWTPDFQGIDERAEWAVSVEDTRIEATRFYFRDQRHGEELIQWGNVIAPDSLLVSERLIGPIGVDRRLVREAVLFSEDAPRIAWYWYRVAGFDTAFPSKAKLLEILAFFRRSPAAELVVMSAACEPDNCRDAAIALRAAVGGPGVLEAIAADSLEADGPPGTGEGDARVQDATSRGEEAR